MREDSAYSHVSAEDFLEMQGIEYRATVGQRGPQFNVKTCPNCGSDSWKVYLNQETGLGNCFVCNKGYTLWTFCGATLDSTDNVAIGREFARLAKQIGWRPKKRPTKAIPVRENAEFKLPDSFAVPTPTGQQLIYLEQRGITPEIARHFQLRYCLKGWFEYEDGGTKKFQNFSERVIIPVFDLNGKMVTFQGRDITGLSEKKYLFPMKHAATARYLYNGNEAFERKANHIVMGEGAFDVMAIKQAIDEDRAMSHLVAVGSFGKNLTLSTEPGMPTQINHLLTLKSVGLEIITILWDGESGALKSALKAAKRLGGFGFETRIAFLPKGKDPAEVSPKLVRQSIRSALGYTPALAIKLAVKNIYA